MEMTAKLFLFCFCCLFLPKNQGYRHFRKRSTRCITHLLEAPLPSDSWLEFAKVVVPSVTPLAVTVGYYAVVNNLVAAEKETRRETIKAIQESINDEKAARRETIKAIQDSTNIAVKAIQESINDEKATRRETIKAIQDSTNIEIKAIRENIEAIRESIEEEKLARRESIDAMEARISYLQKDSEDLKNEIRAAVRIITDNNKGNNK